MSPIEIGLLSVAVMLVLIYLGIHVAFVLALTSFVGVGLIRGNFEIASKLLVQATTSGISDYIFGVVPLFVLMGMLVSAADLGRDSYIVANQIFRRFPGGVGVATVAANTIFAAITGVTIASAAVFSRIAVPEMMRFGYNRRFAVGVVAGSSVLGMLVPPSVLLIVYALITEQSVGAMFLAGIGPGLLLASIFCIGIVTTAFLAPKLVVSDPKLFEASIAETETLGILDLVLKILPTVMLVVAVLGGIYGGVFTPTEAGAVGALLAFLVALAKRKLTFRIFWELLLETGYITASILFIVIAATMYSRMLGISGLPMQISQMVQGIDGGFYAVIVLFVLLALILGTIIDSVSIILITVPLFLPLLAPYDVSLVWFGIVAVLATEIGLLTPPFGISCFVVRSTLADKGISLGDVFIGAAPFALLMLLTVVLIVLFPQIVLVFV